MLTLESCQKKLARRETSSFQAGDAVSSAPPLELITTLPSFTAFLLEIQRLDRERARTLTEICIYHGEKIMVPPPQSCCCSKEDGGYRSRATKPVKRSRLAAFGCVCVDNSVSLTTSRKGKSDVNMFTSLH